MRLMKQFEANILLGQQSFKQCADVFNYLNKDLSRYNYLLTTNITPSTSFVSSSFIDIKHTLWIVQDINQNFNFELKSGLLVTITKLCIRQ